MIAPYDLVALQAVDLEIDRWERERAGLKELAKLREVVELRKSVESDYEEMAHELRSLDLLFDRTNGELKMMEEKLDIAEKKLFGGGMSSRETENRRLEVESLRMRINRQEERALEMMERRDNIAARVEGIAVELERVRRRQDEYGERVRKLWEKIDGRLAVLQSERIQLVSAVPSAVLDIYEELRRRKGGVAAGRLEGRVCGGCHLALSESERKEAAESDPHRCPHCRRILVF